jgi:hypothetical protein
MGKLAIIGCLIFVTGCSAVGMSPGPMFASNFPPDGPPNYQQGMIDGCKTASGAVGYSLYGLIYPDVYYDVDKALNDKVYYKAWKDAYFYCKYEFDKAPE